MTERQLRDLITQAGKHLILKSQSIPDLIQPSEIAPVVLFLASHAANAITGQEILADRGWAYSWRMQSRRERGRRAAVFGVPPKTFRRRN